MAEKARTAAVELSAAYSEKVAAVMLLEDIRGILKARNLGPEEKTSIWSIDLVHDLVDLEDRAWGTWGRSGKPITQERVAAMLRGFKVVRQNKSSMVASTSAATTRRHSMQRSSGICFRQPGEDEGA